MASIVLTGDKALNRKLQRLAGPVAKKIVRQAARIAVKPVLSAARNTVPVRSGKLRRAIKIRALPRSRTRVGVRVTLGDQEFTGETFYGGFQEWGWKTGKRNSTTAARRQIPGRHFLLRAAESQRETALKIYAREISAKIRALAKQ